MASFDGAFANVNSAIDGVSKRWKDGRDTDALLAAYDQSQGLTPAAPRATGLAALGQMFMPQAQPTPPQSVPAPAAPGGSTSPASLISNESGGRWDAQNSATGAGGLKGHFGRIQFGQARLQEAQAAGAIPTGTTPQAFMASPEIQQNAERWHWGDIDQSIKQNGFDRLIGQASIGGVPVTAEGLRAVAHLGGKEGMRKFVETQGAYNPADANGTRLSDYFARHGGGGGQPGVQLANADAPAPGATEAQGFAVPGGQATAQPAGRQNVNPNMIRSLLANPGTRDVGKALWQQTLTGKSFGFQVVGDQLYRTNPQTGTVEPVGVSKPAQPVNVGEGQSLVDPRTGQVIFQGQPKRNESAVYEERRAQATRAGMKEGDPGYQSFVLTGKMPREDAQPLTATDKKAILEADEAIASGETAIRALTEAKGLSKRAMSGPTAGWRAAAGNNLPDWMVPDGIASPEASEATANLENTVTSNALSQMKAIFGGNPTEGERKILLDIQGSINQPDNVRQGIYDRAMRAAEARLAFNRQRATELRGGSYYKPQAGDPGGAISGAPRGSQPQQQPQQAQPDMGQAKRAADGKYYVPDPSRPGKYLMVQD